MLTSRLCHKLDLPLDFRLIGRYLQSVSEREEQTTSVLPQPKNPDLLAQRVIRERKQFAASALECGYSEATASKGLGALVRASSIVAAAVNRETAALAVDLGGLKPLAIQRLHAEIVNPKSSLGMKAIELAGRFKETDWFVRNADVQIGVFAALGEAGPAIDAVAAVIPEEPAE